MQIERIQIRNFRAFRAVDMKHLPRLAILVGANGTGKSTLFSAFGFLRDAMTTNVRTALAKLGGSRGLDEVRSRNADGPIMIACRVIFHCLRRQAGSGAKCRATPSYLTTSQVVTYSFLTVIRLPPPHANETNAKDG